MTAQLTAHSVMRRSMIAAVALLTLASVSGCGRIDKSQWRPMPSFGSRNTATTNTGNTSSGFGTRNRGSGSATGSTRTVAAEASDPNGVIPGAVGGGIRKNSAVLTVSTTTGTCWTLVVDGRSSRGCGNARITDVRGNRAGRVTKTSGGSPITLTLSAGGQTLRQGQVSTVDHYVTVRG